MLIARLRSERGLVLALAGALAVGALLRVLRLAEVPPMLNQDEAVNGYDAFSLLQTARDHHGNPTPVGALETFGDWASPLLTYLTVPAVWLGGLGVGPLRGTSVLVGVLAIPLMYLLGRELSGRAAVGIAAAVLIALSPWAVHLSRWAIPPAVVPTVVALMLWLLARALQRGRGPLLVAAGAAAGFGVLAYPVMKVFVPLALAVAVVAYLRPALRLGWGAAAAAVGAFALIAGPAYWLSAADPWSQTRFNLVSLFRVEPDAGVGRFLEQYLTYFSPSFLFADGDGDPMHLPIEVGIELWVAAPLLLAGLARLVLTVVRGSGMQRSAALLVLGAFLAAPVAAAATVPSPHTLRATPMLVPLVLIEAFGAVALFDLARSGARLRKLALAGAAVLAVGFAVELASRYGEYFGDYRSDVAKEFQYGLDAAILAASRAEADYDEIWLDEINQPYIYVLFYRQWNPDEVHRDLQVQRTGGYNVVHAIGKWHFGGPPFDRATFARVGQVFAPNGDIAYELHAGVARDHGRVLVIDRP